MCDELDIATMARRMLCLIGDPGTKGKEAGGKGIPAGKADRETAGGAQRRGCALIHPRSYLVMHDVRANFGAQSLKKMIDRIKGLVPMALKKRLRSIIDRYECPFCGNHFNEFLPMGLDHPVLLEKAVIGGGRRRSACPYCHSTDRERLLYAYFAKELRIFNGRKDLRILHFAPEKPLSMLFLRHGFKEYICGDLFTEGYTYPDHVLDMNVLSIPYDNDRFDLVICNHVLEHVPDDRKAMREIARVLRSGGRAVLQVPISANSARTIEDPSITSPDDREKTFGQFDHVRLYGQDYPDRLRSAGLKVDRINISRKYRRFGLSPREDLFIATK